MKRNPKFSVGCEVVYKGEDGKECNGSIVRIAEVGRECFMYTIDCKDGKSHSLHEAKITDIRKLE